MSSKKEEERNEKIIRGLMKLPPNRRCINCNSLGPQYVCTNFWTFICIACSGIHREFTHRVKSVSMAKFTAQEVEALQRGGNQRAREFFLKDWDTQRARLPDSSNPDRIREFIKHVYVDKKYAGGKSSDKPPRDMQGLKNHEEDHRRASSYHSFSQSPPYEHQYEDRRYGKQTGMLTRKPGSDRGHYEGKISSFLYSPGRLGEQMYEDRFANEGSGSRTSDYSVSSTGDPFRFDCQSPNFQATGYSSPPLHQVRDILVEDAQPQMLNAYSEANVKKDLDGIPRPQRTASSGSFGSFDSNSLSLKSVNSGSLIDIVLETDNSSRAQQAEATMFPSLSQSSASVHPPNQDLFNLPFVQQTMTSVDPSIDLFADISNQPSSTTPSEQKSLAVPFSENEGWATFDLPHHGGPASGTNIGPSSVIPPSDEAPKGKIDAFLSMGNESQWYSDQSSTTYGRSTLMADQWHVGLHQVKTSADPKSSQSWNAFDDSTGNVPQTSFGSLLQNSESQVPVHEPPTSGDPYMGLKISEDSIKDGFQKPAVDDRAAGHSLPFDDVAGSSFPSVLAPTGRDTHDRKTTNPFDLPYDSDPEPNNVFLDMSSLQAALPNPQLPTAFLGNLGQPWFPQNSSMTTYIPSVPQGGVAYMAGQGPQLANVPSQGPVASLGGNPFA